MKSAIYIWLALIFCILFSTSCQKNTDKVNLSNSIKPFSNYLGDTNTITLKGNVIDNYQEPIKEVTIAIDNKSVITDSLGQFIINNVSSNANFSALSAEKEDYKKTQIGLTVLEDTIAVGVTLYKDDIECLHWFCPHNHNLPNKSD